jgi:hypothetical protein
MFLKNPNIAGPDTSRVLCQLARYYTILRTVAYSEQYNKQPNFILRIVPSLRIPSGRASTVELTKIVDLV